MNEFGDELSFVISYMIARALTQSIALFQAPVASPLRRTMLLFYESADWRTYQRELDKRSGEALRLERLAERTHNIQRKDPKL